MKSYDVVVIGAGVGGLGAAAVLAQHGLRPLVLEKHNLPGGCASSFIRGRFEFETALHFLPLDNPLHRMWADRFDTGEHFSPVQHMYTHIYTDADGNDIRYEIPTGKDEFMEKAEEIAPGSSAAVQKFFEISMEAGEAVGYVTSPDADTVVLQERFPNFLKFGRLTCQQAYDELGIPEKIQDLLNIYWFYLGPRIKEIPFSSYGPVSTECTITTAYFPDHCSHGITAGFENVIRKAGGDIWFNTEATKVLVENGKVRGIETNFGDKIETSNVVSNAAPNLVYHKMIEPHSEVPRETIKLHNSLISNESFFVVYLGLDVPPEEIGITCFHSYINDTNDVDAMYEATFTLEGPYCLGVLCYNLAVKDFSPEGTCVVSISIPIRGEAFENLSQKEYFELKEKLAHKLIARLEERLGGVDISSHIEEIETASPVTFANYINASSGALGYEDRFNNGALVRAACEEDEKFIDGLTFVGQYASSIGYMNIALSTFIADRVAEEIKGGI